MLTAATDLLFTASAIGLVAVVTTVGVAVLPWGARDAEQAGDAIDTAVRLPMTLAQLALSPRATPAPAISR